MRLFVYKRIYILAQRSITEVSVYLGYPNVHNRAFETCRTDKTTIEHCGFRSS